MNVVLIFFIIIQITGMFFDLGFSYQKMYFLFKRSVTIINEGSSLTVVNERSLSKTIVFINNCFLNDRFSKRKTTVFKKLYFLENDHFQKRSFRFCFFLRRFQNEMIVFQKVETIHHCFNLYTVKCTVL